MPTLPPETTIIAIDPTRKGFAFAVLETPSFLVDWGMKNAPAKSGDLRRKVDNLFSRYKPSLLVVEDLAARGCRRRKRAKREIKSVEHLAEKRGVPIERVARLAVQNAFAPGRSKYEIAVKLAEIFQVLTPRLPRRRKAYTTEDARMNIFDALGFARVFEAQTSKQER